jgi:large subunit ribosomal protein L9
MAHTEILLLKPIEGLGGEGDTVKVRAGYARNYLLPLNFALPVTLANRKHIESLRSRRVERESKELDGARELATRLKTVSLAFAVKTGEGGKMFGSVTQGDLHTKLEEQGYKIDKKRVHIPGGHVKTLGKHDASIKLHPEVIVEISFEVVSENPIAETKPADAPAGAAPGAEPGKEYKPRKPRKEYEGRSEQPRERKNAVETLLDSMGPAPDAAKPTTPGDDKKNKGSKKKKK